MNSLFERHGLKIAISLWFISLALPTLSDDSGRITYGIGLFGKGFMGLLFFPAIVIAPLHYLAWFSNFALFWCAFEITTPRSMEPINKARFILGCSLINNLVLGFIFTGTSAGVGMVGDLLLHPGYWVWMTSFGAAFLTAVAVKPYEGPAAVEEVK